MKNAAETVAAVLLALAYPFCMISSSFAVSNSYFGFHSALYLFVRYILLFSAMIILSVLNRRNSMMITHGIPLLLLLTTTGIYIEYFITQRWIYNYAYLLWIGVSLSLASAGVFLGVTFSFKGEYGTFFRNFWRAYLVMYLLILYVAFFRLPNSFSSSVNLELFHGTMKFFKAVFKNPENNVYTALVCFGNIFILLPVPFILSSFKRLPLPVLLVIGILLPILFEAYQYLLHCGNTDIDDVVLNYGGFLLGLWLERLIYRQKIINEKTSA